MLGVSCLVEDFDDVTRAEVPEDFDAVKFLVTVIIGGISGFISATQGWSYLDAQTWLATVEISRSIEYFLKTSSDA